jgi:F420-dependent oxidoreductase-like protein
VQLGIHFTNFTLPGQPGSLAATLAASARAADEGGCATFTLMDHWFQLESFAPPTDPMMEGYTTLGFLAGQTDRLNLGLMVTGVTYRHPGLLAKTVTTLDVLSNGRSTLGIGAAWYEREHRALGVPFPPVAERFARLEETLQICRQMWSDDDGPFEGRHYRLAQTLCSPRPIQRPRPRILIGGGGERKTLRLVATYADACNLFATSPDNVRHKLDVLAGHCAAVDRDPSEIQVTVLAVRSDPFGDPDGFLRAMERYAALGVELVEVMPHGPDPVADVERVCEQVVPRLAEIGSAPLTATT